MIALALLVVGCADPNAPPSIVWDHVACDECGMLVGDPTSAAALIESDGTQRSFDDPGCLFRYVLAKQPHVSRMWFTDGASWYRENAVGFVVGAATPMGSGLHAVPAGTPGALGFGEASSRVVTQ